MAIEHQNTDNGTAGSFNGFCSKWNILLLFLIIVLSLWLNFTGITMGLPSDERFELSLGNVQTVEKVLPDINEFISKGIAERSEFLDKSDGRLFTELARFSPYFDQLRSMNPDEFYVLKVLSGMAKRRDLNPRSYIYGPFYIYQIGAALAAGKICHALPQERSLDYFLKNPAAFAPFYICGRTLCALYGTLAAVVTFLIGYRLGKTSLAFFAATFLACMPLVVMASKFIKADTPTLFWSSLVLLFSLPIIDRCKRRDYLLSGICIGLAAGCKYPAAFTAAYPIMFHIFRRINEIKRQPLRTARMVTGAEGMLLGTGITSFITFACVCPSIILDTGTFFTDIDWVTKVSREGSVFYNFIESTLCLCYDSIFHTLGLPGFLAIIAGIVYTMFKPDKVWLSLFPVVILFLYLTCKGLPNSDAYLMPAFVPLALLAGRAVLAPQGNLIKIGLAAVILVSEFSYALAWNQVTVAENSRITALRWINGNITPGSSIAADLYPVCYRIPVVNPSKYRIYNKKMDGKLAGNADYYIDSSFEWLPPPLELYITGAKMENPPGEEFQKIIEFENQPKAYFGLLELRRSHKINYYFEVAAPLIIIYKNSRTLN